MHVFPAGHKVVPGWIIMGALVYVSPVRLPLQVRGGAFATVCMSLKITR